MPNAVFVVNFVAILGYILLFNVYGKMQQSSLSSYISSSVPSPPISSSLSSPPILSSPVGTAKHEARENKASASDSLLSLFLALMLHLLWMAMITALLYHKVLLFVHSLLSLLYLISPRTRCHTVRSSLF